MNIQLYTASQTSELDRCAIDEFEIPGYTLMSRAGAACFRVLRGRWPEAKRLRVVCGAGNNAGDGYVIARLAREAGLEVEVAFLVEPAKLSGDAARAWQDYRDAGGTAESWAPEDGDAEVQVDAILGTGLSRPLDGRFAAAVKALNASEAPVLAVDIPTGIDADTGAVMGLAVEAQATVTFIGRKRGLLTGEGVDHVGTLIFEDLGVPGDVYGRVHSEVRLIGRELIRARLAGRRPPNAHKGQFGSVAIFGGQPGMPGAVRMAGEAALRSGAGLVKVATHPDHADTIPLACAALMSHAVVDRTAIAEVRDWATVAAVGPGLGQTDWSRTVLEVVLEGELPIVLDADALNLLAGEPRRRDNWILTPHPGEAARLLDTDVPSVQNDRFAAAGEIVARFGGACILKGAGSLVAGSDGSAAVCALGNPGMATAGMGDVLTGIVAAMLAQGFDLVDAAELAVCVHADAGDRAARAGERGLIATDLLSALRITVNPR